MFKLNTQRTYRQPVKVVIYDEQGKEQTGQFTALFKVLPQSGDVEGNLLDHVLKGVEDIEVPGEDGAPLQGEALLDAVKKDPSTATALVAAYQDSILKKNRGKSF